MQVVTFHASEQEEEEPDLVAAVVTDSESGVAVDCKSKLEQQCVALGHRLDHCSSQIFKELRQKMKVQRELFDLASLPQELLCDDSVGMKTVLVKGFLGQRNWCAEDKVAVAELLLSYNSSVLYTQLSMLSQVSATAISSFLHPCTVERNVAFDHLLRCSYGVCD